MIDDGLQLSRGNESEGNFGPRGIAEALFRQRWKALLVFAFIFTLTLLYTFATPKHFDSEMDLLVQNARANQIVTSAESSSLASVSDVSEEQLNSEIAVLSSNDLLSSVVDPGWSPESQKSMSRGDLLRQESAVASLRSHLDISAVRSSHVIKVRMVARTPEAAQQALTSLLSAFLSKQRDLARLPGSSRVFSQKVEQYRTELAAARKDLADYQNRTGFVSVGSRETDVSDKLSGLEASLRSTNSEISELEQRVEADRQQLASTPDRQPTTQHTLPSTQTIDQLNILLVTLKNRRTELLTKFTPSDRLVQEIDKQIADTTEGLHKAQTTAPSELSTDVNPLWQASQRDLANNMVAIRGLEAKRDSLQSQAAALRSNLNTVERQAGDFGALQQRVDEADAELRAFTQRRDASLVSDLMDQQQWLNVAVAQYPTFSLTPSHPRPVIDLALGFLTALLFAGCTVALFEMVRHEVSTPAELEAISRYPVLATIPYAELRAPSNSDLALREERDRRRLRHANDSDSLLEGQA